MARSVRVVVDTNVLISSFIGGRLAAIADLLVDDRVELYTGKDQIAELLDVVERNKFRKYFGLKEARAAVGDLCILASFVNVELPTINLCRDPKDNYLLALAQACKAHFLVTGDKGLLVINLHGQTEVIDPTTFKERMRI